MASPNTYKNGDVAVMKALEICCRQVKRFGPKLQGVIDAALVSGKITTAQHDQATAFISSVTALCDIFKVISGY